jgi:hypothetical protein
MNTHCETCRLPFRKWWHTFLFWRTTVVRFCRGVYCYGCAAEHFENSGHNMVAYEMRKYAKSWRYIK